MLTFLDLLPDIAPDPAPVKDPLVLIVIAVAAVAILGYLWSRRRAGRSDAGPGSA
jgi:hypothetical protein